jgi:hypothetical protein
MEICYFVLVLNNKAIKRMAESTSRYMGPFTDFGFKKLFGEEPNKDLLLDFSNELLKDEINIIYII